MRAQLRRPMPWLVTASMLAAMATVLALRDADWMGDPLWGQETIGVAQGLMLPLLAGAAAIVGWQDIQGLLTLIPDARLRLKHLCATLAVWAVPVVVLYAVANLFVVLASRWTDPSIPNATPWPALTQIGGALLTFLVGYALGVVLKSWLGSVVAALLTAGVLILDRMGVIATGLAEYTASGTMLGTSANPPYFAMRLVWMVLVGAAIVALVVTGAGKRVPLAAALGVALLIGQVAFGSNDSYTVVQVRADSCTSTPVVVCAPPEFRARAEKASQIAGASAATLQALGAPTHRWFVMWQPGNDQLDNLMLIDPGKIRAPLRTRDVVSGVVAPKSCELWHAPEPPPNSWFYSAALVESYVMSELNGQSAEPYGRLLATRGSVGAHDLVLQAATALQECEPAKVPASFGLE
ncbi:hypothetical protein BJ986_002830 [Phycicoccus badiiscoriae]|uniref:Uncharacterized protein n=1 Tax=Pedococcus badiiscoriae TaxID=642776 RepID=A0A852WGF9_9MICO|nr:hypothetical protein [Pedococcus badiiscoriae]NYG08343.1 hypothetical protein [Pedococcus badiiscoriae]